MPIRKLIFARAYENEMAKRILPENRPLLHLSPLVGWMNDPNGFSYYQGQYHLFYQYHPYDITWGPMHWGHAVSKDLLHWTYLPVVMAPDNDYDSFGCFSGSALELPDGRHMLMYTGVRKVGGDADKEYQTQCLAFGDGTKYQKYRKNPVIKTDELPEGLDPYSFRDPKIWQTPDGSYRVIVGGCGPDGLGKILLYESSDLINWKFRSVLAKNDGQFGRMWECPDLYEMDGKAFLVVSPQDMLPDGFEYQSGNGTVCMIGHLDPEGEHFTMERHQTVDYGSDFYASQTILSPDGRRIMIGWMQNWDSCQTDAFNKPKWFGQMSIPREIWLKNDRLYQQPVREIENLRKNKVEYKDVPVNGTCTLDGIEGRCVEIFLTIRAEDPEKIYQKFSMWFAQDERFHTSISFRPQEALLKINRKFSGSRRAIIHQRRCQVNSIHGELKLRILLDRFSAEIFVGEGEQAMSMTLYTDLSAKGISFISEGAARMDITKYDLI